MYFGEERGLQMEYCLTDSFFYCSAVGMLGGDGVFLQRPLNVGAHLLYIGCARVPDITPSNRYSQQ